MKALRISRTRFAIEEIPKPVANGEALVRVIKSGICNTDLELIKGYAGFEGTIGHEFVGLVERSPARPGLEGKRVVGEINAGCGRCDLCMAGDPRHCPDRTVLGIHGRDGAHAEFLKLPDINLMPVPDSISDDEAVFVEPLAAAVAIMDHIDIGHRRVAVIGDGKLGILCARALAANNVKTTLVGKHPEKLAIAHGRKIDTVLLNNAQELKKFGTVVEASGSPSGFETALNLVKPRGTIVLKSTFNSPLTIDSSRIVFDEISVVGSRCGRFTPAIDLLSGGDVPVEDLISKEFPLAQAADAIEYAGKKGVLKVLIRP